MESVESTRISGVGSGSSNACAAEIAESFRFEEEIQSLIVHPNFEASPGGSFTALLGLSGNQAAELLHQQGHTAATSSPADAAEMRRFRLGADCAMGEFHLPLRCSPTFPSDAALLERAARSSVFASEESPASSSSGISPRLKVEQLDSDSPASVPVLPSPKPLRSPAKRKETCEKSKAKGTAKKIKSAEEDNDPTKATATEEDTAGDKLPYVHIHARRGQATDSHSLAERARREKINARMKVLQELVPGCSKLRSRRVGFDLIRWSRNSSGGGGRSGSWRWRAAPPPPLPRPRRWRKPRRWELKKFAAIAPKKRSPERSGPRSRSWSELSPGALQIDPPPGALPTPSPNSPRERRL